MKNYWLLLTPRMRSLINRLKRGDEGSWGRLLVLALVAVGFWIGIFYGFFKVLYYFQEAQDFGFVLARKLMNMVWLTFFAVLLFSNVITALSTFFLSKDLLAIHASPVSQETLFWARLTDTLIDSSWMVFLFGFPVFLAYGVVFKAGPDFYLKLAGISLPFLVLATAAGVIFTQILVNIFPARRTKDIFFLLTIMVVIVLYLTFRFMQPERLVKPDTFASAVSYFASLSAPSSPFLPSHWASEVLWPSLRMVTASDAGFHLLFLWSSAAALAVIASWVCAGLYTTGFSKAQEGARRVISAYNPLELLVKLVGSPCAAASRSLIAKDIKNFFRDNTQWSQLLLLLALIVIYLYNFSVLDLRRSPIGAFYLQNAVSFINVALASFVVASLCVRFVFPAVSQEGFSYWIIRSSPLTLNRFLWTKFYIYAPPLIFVAEVLIVLSNYLLNVTPIMMAISTVTIFFMVLGLVSLGIGLGAIYPRFETENLAQVATGFGGLIFMILAAIYSAAIVMLEAWPVYTLIMAQGRGWVLPNWKIALMTLCFVGVVVINLAIIIFPMKYGHKSLLARETN